MRSRLTASSTHHPSRTHRAVRSKNRFPLWRLLLVCVILTMTYRQIDGFFKKPQAVLVLGGSTDREEFAADFARSHPDLPIWISSGSNPEYTEWVFAEAGIEPERVYIDFQAVDTVTNFTTLVNEFQNRGINSIYVVTSDYHMLRAWVIGEIVLGSRGIDFKPLSVPSSQDSEPFEKVVRDAARSLLWVATGRTGSTLARFIER